MIYRGAEVTKIVERVDNLREPFRKNAIDWLCKRTRRPLSNLQNDLDQFLQEQDPFVRDFFIEDTLSVLELAVTYFGEPGRSAADSRREYLDELMRAASVLHR